MDKKLVNNSNVLRFVEGLRLTAPNTVSLAAPLRRLGGLGIFQALSFTPADFSQVELDAFDRNKNNLYFPPN